MVSCSSIHDYCYLDMGQINYFSSVWNHMDRTMKKRMMMMRTMLSPASPPAPVLRHGCARAGVQEMQSSVGFASAARMERWLCHSGSMICGRLATTPPFPFSTRSQATTRIELAKICIHSVTWIDFCTEQKLHTTLVIARL